MFCEKCGNELLDEAVVCTKCGCLVKNSKQQTKNIEQKNKEVDFCNFFSWASFVLALCAIFSSIFLLIVSINYFSINYYSFIYYIYKFTWIFPSSSLCVLLSIYALKKKSSSISLSGLILSVVALLIELVANFMW